MLGHADLATTEVYIHVTDKRRRESYFEAHPHARSLPGATASRRRSAERKQAKRARCTSTRSPALMLLTTAAGWLMIESGFVKNLLDRRRDRRICPSCGRDATTCACF